jgi:DNA-binding beta-propeller fold protein YncE
MFAITAVSQEAPAKPLTLVQTFELSGVPAGPYADHFAVDVPGHRLFATPQAQKSVHVIDLNTGNPIHVISGFENPHAVFYRSDLDLIFVTDGGAGTVKIFSGKDYHLIRAVSLSADTDAIDYDPATKYLYVSNGGRAAGLDYSQISVLDTATGDRVGDIRVDGAAKLEAFAIEHSGSRIFVNIPPKNAVAVIDRTTSKVIATWPLTRGKKNMAIALDEGTHRLFVGTRDSPMHGSIVVIDTQSGKEIDSLPIGGWVDYLAYDAKSRRLYASCGVGAVYAFEQRQDGSYELVAQADTAVMAKTAIYVPELQKLFVAVPHLGNEPAQVLVFQAR